MIKKSIKPQDPKKIMQEITDLKKMLLNYRFQKSSGQLEKTSEIKITRRKIAALNFALSKQKEVKNA